MEPFVPAWDWSFGLEGMVQRLWVFRLFLALVHIIMSKKLRILFWQWLSAFRQLLLFLLHFLLLSSHDFSLNIFFPPLILLIEFVKRLCTIGLFLLGWRVLRRGTVKIYKIWLHGRLVGLLLLKRKVVLIVFFCKWSGLSAPILLFFLLYFLEKTIEIFSFL